MEVKRHALILVLGYIALCSGQDTPPSFEDYEIFWEDEFDTLDLENKWDHEVTAWGGGNYQFQVYTPDEENSYVEDGKLFLKPTLLTENTNPLTDQPFGEDFLTNGLMNLTDLYGRCTESQNFGCYKDASVSGIIPPIASARLRTYQRFSFKYGRIEIRAKMPRGDWLWPAMWMLPEDWVFGGWPMSGEVDIIEIIGNEDLIDTNTDELIGNQRMGSTIHWGASSSENRWYLTHHKTHNDTNPYGTDFHHFLVDWDENGFRYYVDNKFLVSFPDPPINKNADWSGFGDFGAPWQVSGSHPWGTSQMAPFDQKFHFILNVAVGGMNGYIPDAVENRGGAAKPWKNSPGDNHVSAMEKFYADSANWKPTWEEQGTMQVDYVRVWQKKTSNGASIFSSNLNVILILLSVCTYNGLWT